MSENQQLAATSQPQKKTRRRGRRRDKQSSASASASGQEWSLEQFPVAEQPGKVRFHDLDIPIAIMRAIADLGFEYASPIQAQSLPFTLRGHDVVGKAQTGTGKTAAFLITIIEDLLKNPVAEDQRYAGEARTLIIAPTRELVM